MVGYVNYRSYNLRICMVLGYIISGISYKWDMSKVGHVIRAPSKSGKTLCLLFDCHI